MQTKIHSMKIKVIIPTAEIPGKDNGTAIL